MLGHLLSLPSNDNQLQDFTFDSTTGNLYVVTNSAALYESTASSNYSNLQNMTAGFGPIANQELAVYGGNTAWSASGASGIFVGNDSNMLGHLLSLPSNDNHLQDFTFDGTTGNLYVVTNSAALYESTASSNYSNLQNMTAGFGPIANQRLAAYSVPEPSTIALLAAGAIGLVGLAWRWKRGAKA